MKQVFIIRGLPYCGKTTFAETMAAGFKAMGLTTDILESKDFLNEEQEKEFTLDKKNPFNECFDEFKDLIKTSVNAIFVTDVNPHPDHYQKYIDFARAEGYTVTVLTLQDTHTPVTKIRHRAERLAGGFVVPLTNNRNHILNNGSNYNQRGFENRSGYNNHDKPFSKVKSFSGGRARPGIVIRSSRKDPVTE